MFARKEVTFSSFYSLDDNFVNYKLKYKNYIYIYIKSVSCFSFYISFAI